MEEGPKIFVIQKVISAASLSEALARETEAVIVDITMTSAPGKKIESAVGFIYDISPNK